MQRRVFSFTWRVQFLTTVLLLNPLQISLKSPICISRKFCFAADHVICAYQYMLWQEASEPTLSKRLGNAGSVLVLVLVPIHVPPHGWLGDNSHASLWSNKKNEGYSPHVKLTQDKRHLFEGYIPRLCHLEAYWSHTSTYGKQVWGVCSSPLPRANSLASMEETNLSWVLEEGLSFEASK